MLMKRLLLLFILSACACQTSDETSSLVQPENWWDTLPRPVYASLKNVGVFGDWFEVHRCLRGVE